MTNLKQQRLKRKALSLVSDTSKELPYLCYFADKNSSRQLCGYVFNISKDCYYVLAANDQIYIVPILECHFIHVPEDIVTKYIPGGPEFDATIKTVFKGYAVQVTEYGFYMPYYFDGKTLTHFPPFTSFSTQALKTIIQKQFT